MHIMLSMANQEVEVNLKKDIFYTKFCLQCDVDHFFLVVFVT